MTPYVSCIMLTANRPNFVPLAVGHFLNQTFRNAELVIIDDGKEPTGHLLPSHHRIRYFYSEPIGSIGKKRNYACEKSRGEIIMHWDDDDWYAHDWISRQLTVLESSDADICGLNKIMFFSPLVNKFWNYENHDTQEPWLSGATLAYRRSFWEKHPFKDVNIGEDYDYVWNSEGFIATLHANNTTLKPFEDPRHKKATASNWMDVEFEGHAENPEKE
jgi:glycosyltransferase involved in cell wall biosynthesis